MQLVHYAAAAAGASSGKRVRRATRAGGGRNRSVQRRRTRPAFRWARRAAGQRASGGLGLTDDPRVHQEQVELVGEAVLLARASRCAGIGPQRRSPARPTRGPTPEARRSLLRPTCSSAQHAVSRCVVVPTFASDTATGCPRHARHWPPKPNAPLLRMPDGAPLRLSAPQTAHARRSCGIGHLRSHPCGAAKPP